MKITNKKLKEIKRKSVKVLKLISIIIVTLIIALLLYSAYKSGMLTDEAKLEAFLGENKYIAPIVFIIVKVIVSFIPFIPSSIIMASGFIIFGNLGGMILNYISSIASASFNFYLVKKYGTRFMGKIIPKNTLKKYSKWLMKSQEKFDRILILTNIIPFAPDNMMSMLSALTNISYRNFIAIIIASKIPNVFILNYGMNYIKIFIKIILDFFIKK